jgi:hypothetical protein
MLVLTDIDHTVSDAAWRDAMIGKVSWDDYYTAGWEDKPIQAVAELLRVLNDSDYYIVAVTARPEKWRALTVEWLIDHEIPVDELLMRPDDCRLPGAQVKANLISSRFGCMEEVAFALEDRDDMVVMYKLLGITVLQVHK